MRRTLGAAFIVCLVATVAFQHPQEPTTPRPAKKKLAAAMAKQSEANKAAYHKANEELKQAWLKQESEARTNLEKSGIKVEDLQKQAREDAAAVARNRGGKAAVPDPKDAASATWTRVTQRADQIASRLTSMNPAWRARSNDAVRRMVANHIWFEPEITAVTTPLTVNPNTVVTHYTPAEGYGGHDGFHHLSAGVRYTNVGAEYQSDYEYREISIPANARTVRVVLRDGFSHSYLRNLVLWGYGSAETKFTMSLTSPSGTELASVSQSMQRSIFLFVGYYQESSEALPTVELTWNRPPGNTDRFLSLKFQVDAWAGGGPIGSVGDASYSIQMRAFDVITNS